MQFELSDFAIKLILLFLPGIISFLIINILTNHKEFKFYFILIYSLLLGFLNYFIYYLIIYLFNYIAKCFNLNFYKTVTFFDFINGILNKVDFFEIIIVCIVSIPVGFLFVIFINHNFLNTFAHHIKSTKKYSEVDVWSHLMNTKIPGWVYIRDIKNNLVYYGYIKVFSDSTEQDELFLKDVKVFRNSDAKFLYEIPGLYLCNSRKNMIIEFPYTNIISSKKVKKKVKK